MFRTVLGRQLTNSKHTILGRPVLNANGDIDPTSAGYKYVIDTLSYIRSRISEQKFFEVNIADFLPMDVGEAAWSEEIVHNLEFYTAGGFFDGDVDTMAGNGRIATVGSQLAPIRMPVKTWAKAVEWTIMEIAKAAAAGNWDVVESKMKSIKKNWDLGIQEVAFLGHPSDSAVTGLLNDGEVNINTTLITQPIKDMSDAEFQTFVGGLMNAFWANSNDTALPNKFVIPTSDYLGLANAASASFPNISKLEYLRNALQATSMDAGFEIRPLAYCEAARNSDVGINKNRYVLYRDDPDTMSMSIPVDFTMLEPGYTNRIMMQQPAYGQYSGVLITRKREVLYLDETAAS